MSGKPMNDWLAAARQDIAAQGPDEIVEMQLLARVRERRALQSIESGRPAPARRPVRWWMRLSFGVPAACAAILLVVLGGRLSAPVRTQAPAPEMATPFIALVAREALAAERAPVLVSSAVARTALADYGLPVDPARADESIGAEFLVSRTGVVLAVRFKE